MSSGIVIILTTQRLKDQDLTLPDCLFSSGARRLTLQIVSIGFQVLTAVNKKSRIFWHVTPYRSIGYHRHYSQTSVKVYGTTRTSVITKTIDSSNYECLRTMFSGNQYLRRTK
jgi:hypothetical protein